MRKYLLAALLLVPVRSFAAQLGFLPDGYFRLLDYAHPRPVVGALLAPEDLGASEATSLLPLITHSPKDGCLMPSFVCEDWSPLSVGASMNAGKLTLAVAPLANVLPWMQRGARMVVPEGWQATRRILTPSEDTSVTFSAGPVWQYRQDTNKGYFRVFTGFALQF